MKDVLIEHSKIPDYPCHFSGKVWYFKDFEKHTKMVSNHLRRLYINKIPKHEWQGFYLGIPVPALSLAVIVTVWSLEFAHLSAGVSSFRDQASWNVAVCLGENKSFRISKCTNKNPWQNSQKSWLIHDGICRIILPVTHGSLGSTARLFVFIDPGIIFIRQRDCHPGSYDPRYKLNKQG